MKKTMLLGVLMLSAAAGYAQESRQDVSFSGTGIFGPRYMARNVQQSMTGALGLLLSYRYMVTPRSALEANYSFAQNDQKYDVSYEPYARSTRACRSDGGLRLQPQPETLQPFAEVGVGTLIFTRFWTMDQPARHQV